MKHLLKIFIVALSLFSSVSVLKADVIYVDQNSPGAETGSSWGTAYKTVRAAVTNSIAGDSIWIADGTYDEAPTSIVPITLNKSLSFFGGFSGNEMNFSDRDVNVNEAILTRSAPMNDTLFFVGSGGLNLTFDGVSFDGVTDILTYTTNFSGNSISFSNGEMTNITRYIVDPRFDNNITFSLKNIELNNSNISPMIFGEASTGTSNNKVTLDSFISSNSSFGIEGELKELRVSNSVFQNNGQNYILSATNHEVLEVTNTKFISMGSGAMIRSNNTGLTESVVVDNCLFQNTSSGAVIEANEINDIRITNCVFDDPGTSNCIIASEVNTLILENDSVTSASNSFSTFMRLDKFNGLVSINNLVANESAGGDLIIAKDLGNISAKFQMINSQFNNITNPSILHLDAGNIEVSFCKVQGGSTSFLDCRSSGVNDQVKVTDCEVKGLTAIQATYLMELSGYERVILDQIISEGNLTSPSSQGFLGVFNSPASSEVLLSNIHQNNDFISLGNINAQKVSIQTLSSKNCDISNSYFCGLDAEEVEINNLEYENVTNSGSSLLYVVDNLKTRVNGLFISDCENGFRGLEFNAESGVVTDAEFRNVELKSNTIGNQLFYANGFSNTLIQDFNAEQNDVGIVLNIYNSSETPSNLSDLTFKDNTISGDAILLNGTTGIPGTYNIQDAVISGNSHGSIYSFRSTNSNKLSLKNVDFIENELTFSSSSTTLMSLSGGTAEMDDVIFTNNEAPRSLTMSSGDTLLFKNSHIFIDPNLGLNTGGGIQTSSMDYVSIDNSTFKNVNAISIDGGSREGGALYIGGNSNGSDQVIVKNSVFENCGSFGRGGAIVNFVAMEVDECSFNNCVATDEGGAIYSSGDLVVANSIFNGNMASLNGVAISANGTQIDHCTFESNTNAPYIVRAIGSSTLTNSIFRNNTFTSALIQTSVSDFPVINSLFEKNSGNGPLISAPSTIISNSTIVGNTLERLVSAAGYSMNNSIVWNNLLDNAITQSNITYTDIQGGHEGDGNLDVYPEFLDPTNGDYRLSCTSPVINQGNNSFAQAGTDFYGVDRITAGTVDMGAFEFDGDPGTVNADPLPAFTVNSPESCSNESIEFVNNTLNTDVFTYFWDFGSIGVTSTEESPFQTFDEGGTYSVSLTATNGCGRTETIQQEVVINDVVVQGIQHETFVCPGDTVEFTTKATCNNLVWSVTNGTVFEGQGNDTIQVIFSNVGNGQNAKVQLLATDCGGLGVCEIPVEINIPIIPTQQDIQGQLELCENEQSWYRPEFSDLVPGVLYEWSVTGGSIISNARGYGVDSVQIEWGSAGIGELRLRTFTEATDSCAGGDTISVTIRPQFNLTAGSINCGDETQQINVSPGGLFDWLVSGADNTIDSDGLVSWGNIAGNYEVVATSNVTTAFCNLRDTIDVQLIKKPEIDTILGEVLVDTFSIYDYEVISTDLDIVYNTASVIGGTRQLSDNQTPKIIWNGTQPFELSATVRTNVGLCVSDPFVLPVKRDLEFEIIGPDTVCINTLDQFNSNIDTSAAIYQWVFEGQTTTASVNSPDFAFNTPGKTTITLLVDINGRLYQASKEVFVDRLIANFNLSGTTTISPEGGGSFIYEFNNANGVTVDYEVDGSVTDALNTSTVDVTWNTTGPYEIRLFGTKAGEVCATDTTVLEVVKAEIYDPVISFGGGKLCVGDSGVFTLNSDEFTNSITWSVNNDAVVSQSEGNRATIQWPNATGTYTITVNYDRFGAGSKDTIITLDALPTPTLAGATICGERDTVLRLEETYASYIWTLQPEAILIDTDDSTTIRDAGIYQVTVTDVRGCIGTTSKSILKIGFPEIEIYNKGTSSYCPSEVQTFANVQLETPENINLTYNWFLDEDNTPVGTLSTLDFDVDRSLKGTETDVKLIVSIPECVDSAFTSIVIRDTCVSGGGNTCTDLAANFSVDSCAPYIFVQTAGLTDTIVRWDFDDGTTATGDSVAHIFPGLGIYDVSMRVGCSFRFRRVEVPISVDFTFPEDVCSGDDVQFEDYTLNLPGTNILSYEWDFGDGDQTTGLSEADRSTLHNYTDGGDYPVTLTIEVRNTEGDTCLFTKTQTISVKGAPKISFDASAPDCEFPTYVFDNTSIISTTEATYSWLLEGVEFVQEDIVFTYADVVNLDKDVQLTITDVVGCSSTLDTTITILTPTIKQDIQVAGITHLCEGDIVMLTAPSSLSTYEWFVNDVLVPLGTQEFFVTQPGIYNVRYEAPECQLFSTDLEITSFEPATIITEDDLNCVGENILLSLQDLPSDVTISWSKDGGNEISTSSSLFISDAQLSDAGSYEVTLREKATTACEFTLPAYVLDVFDLPAEPDLALSKEGVCFDSSSTATINNFVPASTYLITASGNTDTLFTSSLELDSLTASTTVQVSVTDVNGCNALSEAQEVLVNPEIDHKLTAPTELCQFEYLEVKSNLSIDDFDYQWLTLNPTTLSSTSNSYSSLIAQLTDEASYYAIATSNSNATVAGCSYTSDTVFVDILPAPVKPIITGGPEFCEGDVLSLSIESTTDSITWNTGGNGELINVRQGGLYSVTLTNRTSQCEAKDLLEVIENPLPNFNFVGTGYYSLCGNQDFELEALSDFARFQWKLNGNGYGNPNIQLVPRQSGNYTVEVETFNGCIAESDTLRITSEACGACEVITTVDDIGVGSLRDAIICANSNVGVDFIVFNLQGTGPFQFAIDSALPVITEGVVINGFSQSENDQHLIEILPGLYDQEGFNIGSNVEDFSLTGVKMTGFENAVKADLSLENALIRDNIFTANDTTLNIDEFNRLSIISDNVFSDGVAINLAGNDDVTIARNEFDNLSHAILAIESDELVIEENEFTNLSGDGVVLQFTDSVFVRNNYFGQTEEGVVAGNAENGIVLDSRASITNNVFANHQKNGVLVYGGGFQLNGEFVTGNNATDYGKSYVFQNQFLNNGTNGIETYGPEVKISQNEFVNATVLAKAIELTNGGNTQKPNFGIDSHDYGYSTVILKGFGPSGDTIEFFRNNGLDQQALEYIGSVENTTGSWSFEIEVGDFYSSVDTSYYVMTMTNSAGNTTELDDPYPVAPNVCGGIVNNTADAGSGSFRREVECANLDPDFTNILFDLDTVAGDKVINLQSFVDVIYPVNIYSELSDSITLSMGSTSLRFFTDSDSSFVEGLIFDGGNTQVRVLSVNKFFVDSSIFRNASIGLEFASSDQYEINGSIFEDNARAILNPSGGTTESSISNSIFRRNSFSLSLGGGSQTDVGNQISDSYFYDNTSEYVMEITTNLEVTNSHFGIDENGQKKLNADKIARGVATQGATADVKFFGNEFLGNSEMLRIYGLRDTIRGNYFGISKDGNLMHNASIGINTSFSLVMEDNLFGNFDSSAVILNMLSSGTGNNIVENNQFGFDSTGNPIPNQHAIVVTSQPGGTNYIQKNVIGNSLSDAILLINSASNNTVIDSNFIGIGKSNEILTNNGSAINSGSRNTLITNNVIANNDSSAVKVSDISNLVSQNIFFDNFRAIEHIDPNGNNLHPMPVMDSTGSSLTTLVLYGHATAGDTVEVYRNDGTADHALELLDRVEAGTNGVWSYTFTNVTSEVSIIATATDANNNTSEFSAPYLVEPYVCSGVVSNTNDDGNGSLRRELECALALDNDITVDIAGSGNNTITLVTPLPDFDPTSLITISGLDAEGDSLVITGTGINGFTGSNVALSGFIFDGLDTAVVLGENGTLNNSSFVNNTIGVDIEGTSSTVTNSTFDNNSSIAISIAGSNATLTSNEIRNSGVGVNVTSTGLTMSSNTITSSISTAITLFSATDASITGNTIGESASGMGSNNGGIVAINSSDITIAQNTFYDENSDLITIGIGSQEITISQNLFDLDNGVTAIDLVDDVVNNSKDTPSVESYDNSPTQVVLSGTGTNGDIVEIFVSNGVTGVATKYIGSSTVINGIWTLPITSGVDYNSADTNKYALTCTDGTGNTSELSVPQIIDPYVCSFEVTSALDNGNGTLHRALECANVDTDLNVITFNIGDVNPDVINLVTDLPTITSPVEINGSGNITILSSLTSSVFNLQASNSRIDSLSFSSLNQAIAISGSSNTVLGNNFVNVNTAVSVTGASGNTITENNMTGLGQFVAFASSSNNFVTNNNLSNAVNVSSLAVIENDNASSQNLISQNLFTGLLDINQLPIENNTNGNIGLAKPEFTGANVVGIVVRVTGTAPANSDVEVYFGDNIDLKNTVLYHETVTASAAGNWFIDLQLDSVAILLATATDGNNNTSEFSDPYLLNQIVIFCPVTNVLDTGEGSLRDAVSCVNEAGVKGLAAIINFDLDDTQSHTIDVINTGFTITNAFNVTVDPLAVDVTINSDNTSRAFDWSVPNITMNNLKFTAFDTAVYMNGATSSDLVSNTFSGFDKAVVLENGVSNTVLNNTFLSGTTGISTLEEQSMRLQSNKFGETGSASSLQTGIETELSHGFNINSNLFYDNITGTAITVDTSSNGSLNANTFTLTDVASSILVNNSELNTISNNNITNGVRGILLTNVESHLIRGNKVDSVAQVGIELQNSELVRITQNTNQGLELGAKPIELNYGTALESNEGYPVPEFINATYKNKRVYIRGKAQPESFIEIFHTDSDSLDLASYQATVQADVEGFFVYSFSATTGDINENTFRATATYPTNILENDTYRYTSEASKAFNPNLKVCFVTKDTDVNEIGTLRYNINEANIGECNLILFEVGTSPTTISPQTDLPIITADNLTIDGTCQPGYTSENPSMWINNDNSLDRAFRVQSDSGSTVFIHGLGIRDYESAIAIDDVHYFENTISQIENFTESAIDFNDTDSWNIFLDSNRYVSSISDYVLDIQSPNVRASRNRFEGGQIHNINVSAGTTLFQENEISPFLGFVPNGTGSSDTIPQLDSVFAIRISGPDTVTFESNVIDKYFLGVVTDGTSNLSIQNNAFVAPKDDSITFAIHLSNIDTNVFVLGNIITDADTAIFVQNADKSTIGTNQISQTNVAIHVLEADSVLIQSNEIISSHTGVWLDSSFNTLVDFNTIYLHDSIGVLIDSTSDSSFVTRNTIGSPDANSFLSSKGLGVMILSDGNLLGGDVSGKNEIFFNEQGGVWVKNAQSNKMTYNHIFRNDTVFETPLQLAIKLMDNGNLLKQRPAIDTYEEIDDENYIVKGFSEPNDSIHLYRSEGYYESARYYIGRTQANASGEWEIPIDITTFPADEKLENQTLTTVATATDADGNTSQLSDLHFVGTCYVNNTQDGIDNEYPYPNSFRQAVKCLNSLPQKDSILVALDGGTGFFVGAEREMIALKTPFGGVIDGQNLIAPEEETISFVSGWDKTIKDSTLFWEISSSVGATEIKNLEAFAFDTAFSLKANDSLTFENLNFVDISKEVFALESGVTDYAWDSVTVSASGEANVFNLASGTKNMSIVNSSLTEVKNGVLSNGTDSLTVNTTMIKEAIRPVDLSNSNVATFTGNTFGIRPDTLPTAEPLVAINIENSRLIEFGTNTMAEIDTGLVFNVLNSDSIIVESNDFGTIERGIYFTDVTGSSIFKNTFDEVDSIAVYLINTDSIFVVENEISELGYRGFINESSTQNLFLRNLVSKVDTVDGKNVPLIVLSLNTALESNLGKPKPSIDGFFTLRGLDCENDEDRLGIYLNGSAEPRDSVEIFLSDTLSTTFTKYLGATQATETGYWEFRIPREEYKADLMHIFGFTATATQTTRNTAGKDTLLYTSQEADLFTFDNVSNDIIVRNTNSTGANSLRFAIDDMNCSDIYNRVFFNIEETAPHEIIILDSAYAPIDAYLGFEMDASGSQGTFDREEGRTDVDSTVIVSGFALGDSSVLVIESSTDTSKISNLNFEDAQYALTVFNTENKFNNLSFSMPNTDTDSSVAIIDSTGGGHVYTNIMVQDYEKGFLFADGSSGSTIINSTTEEVEVAVHISGNSSSTTVKENQLDADSVIIVISDATEVNTIQENTFGTELNPIQVPAISIERSDKQIITGNYVPKAVSIAPDTVFAVIHVGDLSDNNQINGNRIGINDEGLSPDISNMIGIRLAGELGTNDLLNNIISKNDIAGLDQPAIWIEGATGGLVSSNFFGVDTAYFQRVDPLTYIDISGIDASAVVIKGSESVGISGNDIVNYTEYGIDIETSNNISMESNKIFSQKSENKGINLHYDDLLLESNAGVRAPSIDTNGVIAEDEIWFEGTSSSPNATLQLYEAFIYDDIVPSQALRYVDQVQTDDSGDWRIQVPSESFGFNGRNNYVAQVSEGQNTSELSENYVSQISLCVLVDNNINLFPDTSFTPCPGSAFTADAQLQGITYSWTADNNEFDEITTQMAQIDVDAPVTLTLSDDSDCDLIDKFTVTYKEKPVDPEFIVSSNIFVGDTIVLIDISQQQADSLDWFSSDAITIIPNEEGKNVLGPDDKLYPADTNVLQFIVPEEGVYTVTQRSIKNGCFVSIDKEVNVTFKDPDEPVQVELIPGISNLTVFPNPVPSDGTGADIEIETTSEEEIILSISDPNGRIVFGELTLSGETSYEVNFVPENAPGAVYIVTVVTKTSSLKYKILINNP